MTHRTFYAAAALSSSAFLTACGGGGGSSAGGGIPSTPTPTAMPTVYAASGTVVSIPQETYGASASPQNVMGNATVVISTMPVNGATPPASAPAGGVMVQTKGDGTFSASVTAAPIAPPSGTFVPPSTNLSGFTAPTSGYFVAVFATGVDGVSANAPLPYHSFLAAGAIGTIRVTTASAAEAGFLADVNAFRSSKRAQPLIFDELAEEAARLHAADEGKTPTYYCHFDRSNHGPQSRYLGFGALGVTGESVALIGGSSSTAYAVADGQFEAEGAGGSHFDNLVNTRNAWAGLAQFVGADSNSYIDQELVTPNYFSADTYPVFAGSNCPSGTTANGS